MGKIPLGKKLLVKQCHGSPMYGELIEKLKMLHDAVSYVASRKKGDPRPAHIVLTECVLVCCQTMDHLNDREI